jgi:hypothetical protein
MTDAGQTSNTTGSVEGDVVQIGDVRGNLTINYGSSPGSPLFRVTVVIGLVVVALLVLVANLGSSSRNLTGSRPQSSSPAAGAQPPGTRPADDGPGYLLPSDNDRKAIDFYDNEHHDAVIWDRHPPGTDPSHQPHWVREFTDSGAFRIRDEQANRCLEPVTDPVRGDHVVANACSSGSAQLWRTRNTAQLTSVEFGGCLSVANNGSYDNGTWLHLANCADRPDQNWRVVR